MSSKFSLIVSLPDQDPKTFALDGESKSVGRGPDNDIQILISEVSVKHGSIEIDGDTCTIKDNGSTNGTKVNGEKVGPDGKALSPMDKVLMGETISCYFVPTAVLDSTPAEELIQSIEASPKATTPKTAPVAVAAPAQPGAPAAKVASPAPAKPGAPAGPPKPGGPPAPAKPGAPAAPAKPAAVAQPAPVKPGSPPAPAKVATPAADAGATTVKLDQVKPSAPGPVAPKPPGGVKPPTAAPSAPGAPQAPKPVPLKAPGAAPAAPSIPLPGKKPGAEE
ncbi:MAG: hypothetical protein CMO55_22355 [Verrucomicrobiales bacterium]|nr:hypothetical protein [Verrucomicrobiales bacterium]